MNKNLHKNNHRGKKPMIKNKVRQEICLLLVVLLIVSLASGQTVYAASNKQHSNNQKTMEETSSILSAIEQPSINDDQTGFPALPNNIPSLNTEDVYLLANGDSYELQVSHAVHASYELLADVEQIPIVILSNESAQSVTITPSAPGQTVLSVTATAADGSQTILTCRIIVSELSIEKESVDLYLNDSDPSEDLAVKGIELDTVYYGSGDEWKDYSIRDAMIYETGCSIRVGNPKVADAYFSDGTIHISAKSKGITNIRMNIYGVSLSVRVTIHHYTLNKYAINTYLGSDIKNLKLKGAGNHKVTWSTGNKRVASVSKTGIVTINGIGTTKITAKVNGRKVVCIVSVSTRTAYRVVRDARAITNKKNIQYSQQKRMSSNYYDCSSLVYRCYRIYGLRFGYTHPTWAPTAADEGRWCAATKHLVSEQAVTILDCKLVPGDTIYYSFNGNNGRYRNIDHTAIFAGYAYDASIGYYGTVIEASSSSNTVTERMYYASDSIQLIGRPSKK